MSKLLTCSIIYPMTSSIVSSTHQTPLFIVFPHSNKGRVTLIKGIFRITFAVSTCPCHHPMQGYKNVLEDGITKILVACPFYCVLLIVSFIWLDYIIQDYLLYNIEYIYLPCCGRLCECWRLWGGVSVSLSFGSLVKCERESCNNCGWVEAKHCCCMDNNCCCCCCDCIWLRFLT